MIKSESIFRWFFHSAIKPVLAVLSERNRNKLMTIAHHIKMTLFYGHVMQFGKTTVVAQKSAAVPSWVIDELRELAEIEVQLLPTPEYLGRFHAYRNVLDDNPGRVFAVCRKLIAERVPDIIFIVPWMKRGGADLGVLHHIERALKKNMNVALITTLDADSSWINRVPKQVPVIELGKLGRNLTETERVLVLVRLILQSNSKVLHIINSELGWEMVKKYGKSLVAMKIATFASLYCDDFDASGKNYGFGCHYLSSTLPYLSGIICDTQYYPKELVRRYGADAAHVYSVYFPTDHASSPQYISSDKGGILWASRIARQKRPDILLKIALAMPGFHFYVKGYAELEEEKVIEKKLRHLPNVTLIGAYSKLIDDDTDYCLFLYTSEWDGLPNVLLEATMAGLPIVSSSAGGVSELINEENGYLINELDSVDDYVSAIRRAVSYPEERYSRWKNALGLVQKRHSFEAFAEQMAAVEGYFNVQAN